MDNRPNYQLRFNFKLTPTIKRLIIIIASVFLFSTLIKLSPVIYSNMLKYFALIPGLITQKLFLWQYFTYIFFHANFSHLFFNLFALWIFGSDLESLWGGKRFLQYFFLTGIGAGVFIYFFSMNSLTPVIGASGAVYGVLAAYGLIFPNRKILIFFILPVKAIYLVLAYGGIEFIYSLSSSGDGIAHLAHLGGLLIGVIYLVITKKTNLTRIFSNIKMDFKSSKQGIESKYSEFSASKIQKLRNKVSEEGIESLSDEEKEYINEFLKKYGTTFDKTTLH